jgi:hypothetical protein
MPRVSPISRKAKPQAESFRFTQAIAMEHLRSGFVAKIVRGTVYPIDHPMVRQFPEFWRALGPRVDELGEVNDAA